MVRTDLHGEEVADAGVGDAAEGGRLQGAVHSDRYAFLLGHLHLRLRLVELGIVELVEPVLGPPQVFLGNAVARHQVLVLNVILLVLLHGLRDHLVELDAVLEGLDILCVLRDAAPSVSRIPPPNPVEPGELHLLLVLLPLHEFLDPTCISASKRKSLTELLHQIAASISTCTQFKKNG